ncbi:discoidin domain-containing protein [Pyxidicoccus xibeiensis]|uniref:discoidin domain-containing protein n=1 Tax=Pyxidicoccus xibeiensis TaxID=2906759 RepID=UPI0020A79186|nr:discoidin domain-containing protein [Pyxidicoccus xibeiensis]MCP3143727.1 discoidin domain-containing protein [Pyxidicoccus xibeiensis]
MRSPLLLLPLLATSALAASTVLPGYIRADDWLERESQPERYVPLHLLDGRDTTAWCATGEKPAPITLGFKDAVTVDEVRVYTGDGSDRAAFKAHARARKLTLASVDASRSLTVEDKRGLQAVRLSQPLSGARFILEVVDRFPGASDDAPVCVTDLVFYSGGKALNGTWLAPKLKYDARQAPLLGTWFGGLEGAPEGFLSFYMDGTWRYTREPLEGGGPTSVTGTYTLSGTRLSLDVPKRGRVTAKLSGGSREGTRSPDASLVLEGAVVDEWGREFRGQP